MARPDFSLEPDLRTTPAVILGINSGLERILPLSHAAKESGSRRELASSKDVHCSLRLRFAGSLYMDNDSQQMLGEI